MLAAVIGLFMFGLAARQAVALEPNNASDIVRLGAAVSTSPECPEIGVHFVLAGPDGTPNVPFTLPNNQVLVVTSFEWAGFGGTMGNFAQATAFEQVGEDGFTAIRSLGVIGPDQVSSGQTLYPTGVILEPREDRRLCLFIQDGNTPLIGTAFLYGFVAKNR